MHIIMTQGVQGDELGRICILVQCSQQIQYRSGEYML